MYKTNSSGKLNYSRKASPSKNIAGKRLVKLAVKSVVSLFICLALTLIKQIDSPISNTIKNVIKYDIPIQDVISKFNLVYNWSKQIELKNLGQVGKSYCYTPTFHEYLDNVHKIDNNLDAGNIDYSSLKTQDIDKPTPVQCTPKANPVVNYSPPRKLT